MYRIWKACLNGQWYATTSGNTYIPVSKEPSSEHASAVAEAEQSDDFKYSKRSLRWLLEQGANVYAEAC